MRSLLLVYNKQFAIFPDIVSNDIEINEVWRKRKFDGCFWVRVLQKLPFPCLLFLNFFLGDWRKHLEEYDKIVIFDSAYCDALGRWLKKIKKKEKCYIYMWDGGNRLKLKEKQILPIYSYNRDDALIGMLYNPLFYTKKLVPKQRPEIQYDVFLCMHGDASRREYIDKYCSWMQASGFRTKFCVVADEHEPYLNWNFKNEAGENYIEYHRMLNMCIKSKAIMEIVHEGEKGAMTLRVMEALFLKQKLITTNERIAEQPFYNKNQIYILNEESMDIGAMQRFLNAPFDGGGESELDYYDIETWLTRF